ncbi:MAG TPA: glycosyl hydrolase [Verrucomicrobiae bacterium]|nr:glycosyl hydrolase [Verrucomicrobiae bacterium]
MNLKSLIVLLLSLSSVPLRAGDLSSQFVHPPDSAKPHTWWHWMNGNITKTGITADLEAMKEIGLGGATIVNVDCDVPPGPVKFMSPEWRDDFKFAVQEANRLGLKLSVENCAGWSSSGGRWNTVTNAMQRLTSAETNVQGPVSFDAVLPQPPIELRYYRDIGVLAFQTPMPQTTSTADVSNGLQIQSAIYGSKNGGGSADVTSNLVARIQRGEKSVVINNQKMGGDPAFGQHKQLQLKFVLAGKPEELTIKEGDRLIFPTDVHQLAVARLLENNSASHTFVRPSSITNSTAGQLVAEKDVVDLTDKLSANGRLKWSVPPGNWTILRLGYTPIGVKNHPAPKEGEGLECDKLSKSALDVHWNGFMQKVLDDVGPLAGKTLNCSLIDSYEVGNQDWTADFRREFEKRRGYDPLKFLPTFTHRVVDSSEVTERFLWDMRRTVADLFADNYFGHFTELCHQHGLMSAIEPYSGPFESLQSGSSADVVMGEFWTGSKGHPSVKLVASLAHIYGKRIAGAESFTASSNSGRWQNDPYSLKALGDLMFCQGLNQYTFHRYAMQPWTNRWPGMTMGPWGIHFERTETWWRQGKAWIDYITRCQFMLQQGRAVQDVAYFTGEGAPKEMSDQDPAMPDGYDFDAVNADVLLHGATVRNGRITLASGASYAALVLPTDDPNMTPRMLDCIFNLARDGATVIGPRPKHSPSLSGYPECDAKVKQLAGELWGSCDGKSVLENRFGKGRIVWGESLETILKDQNLSPDFEVTDSADGVDLKYAHRRAGDADIYFVSNQKDHFGSARCLFRVNGKIPELWHPDTGVMEPAPIWSEKDGRTEVRLNFDPVGSVFVVFRHATGTDHLVNAHSELTAAGEPIPSSSPGTGHPPIWEVKFTDNGSPQVKSWGNGLIKLSRSNGTSENVNITNVPPVEEIAGPWTLNFPPNWGAPPSIALNDLISWTDSTNDGVRYFSGTATYQKEIEISADSLQPGKELWLDLGMVKNFAEVSLNGKDLGILWKPPFRVNITSAAKAGTNRLVIKVTNLWRNRLIGDEQLPPDCEWNRDRLKQWPQWLLDGKPSPTGRFTFTTWHHYSKNSPLLPSGLLGPVTLQTAVISVPKSAWTLAGNAKDRGL